MAKRPSMACARRAVGQRSVSKPKALGPAANISRTSALWVDDKRLGRPGALRLRRWSNPCPSRVRYQREAVVRLTPNLRATRACVIPWSRSPAASRRLRSISSRFNVTVTAAYIPSRADFWPEQSQYTPKHFRCKLIFHVWGKFLGEGPEGESGALKFLKNIVILPGCGQFLAPASFVLRAPHSHELVGVVLTS